MEDARRTGPVFVDPTGRRSRVLSRICLTLGALMAAYVALVVLSLLGPPGLSRLTLPGVGPVLPGPAAAPLATGPGRRQRPAQLLPSSRPSALEVAPVANPAPSRTAVAGPAAVPAPRPPSPGVSPSPSPSPAPGRSASAQASPRPSSTSTKTPPGQSTRPTPHSTRTPPPRPSRSPR